MGNNMEQQKVQKTEPDMVKIGERISCIMPTTDPLSSNVAVIEGKENIWLYDVGKHPRIPAMIAELKAHTGKNLVVILSHFHPDHIGNLSEIEYEKLYVGKNTYRYTHCGEIIEHEVWVKDGEVTFCIFPIPSSHAKGSLALEVNESCCFWGDALYPAYKHEHAFYNVGILREQIKVVQDIAAPEFMLSHKKILLQKKQGVLAWLKSIYAKRSEGEAWIEVQ